MKRDPLASGAVLLLALVWGYNWVVIKIATHDADALLVTTIRSAVGALCLFAALAVTRRSLRPTPIVPTALLGLLQTTLFTVLQVLAVATGGAGKTAILVFTMPFWIAIIAWPALHERPTRNQTIALILAAAGLALVLLPFRGANGLVSEILAVSAAIVWAASAVFGKVLRARYKTDLLALTSWQMLWGTLPLVAACVIMPNHVFHPTPPFWFAITYVALPGTALAWLLWMFILSRLSAGTAGVASLLTPVVGVAAAWLQLGEQPGPLELIGLGFIVAALAVNLVPATEGMQRAAATD